MESIPMPVPEKLSAEAKKELTAELKETVATNVIRNAKGRTFTSYEMWNRSRRMRSASDMMRKWNLN